MDYELKGKTALVTGGARGIGRSIVLALAREGAHVVVCDIASAAAEETAADARRMSANAIASVTDVTDADAVNAMVTHAEKALGPLEIVVNNAGVRYDTPDQPAVGFKPVWELSRADWDRQVGLILYGTVNTMNAVMSSMRLRKSGRIINISSPGGRMGIAGIAAYGAAKAAVVQLTRIAAMELAPYRITVNCVSPGFMASHSVGVQQKDDFHKETERQWFNIPLGAPGDPVHVANMVAYLAGKCGEWVTGQLINTDGGQQIF
ncbi:MAG: SDR family NAD(P)-dependent oxidoreductase [Gammaproteobacteria bacterium]